MSNLGYRSQTGKADPSNPLGANFWTVTFDPAYLAVRVDAEVYHMAVSGPAASSFQVYLDTAFYDYVSRGDINSWDPSQPLHIRPGQSMYFYWNTNASPAPKVSMFLRTASPL